MRDEIASLIITNAIVIILFITTYLLIDSRNLIKEENKQRTAQILLTQSFAECYNSINVFTPEVIEKYVVPKCNFNQTSNQDPVITGFKTSNFTFDMQIFEYSREGIIAPEDFEFYLKLKRLYQSYIEIAITFFDAQEIVKPEKEKLLNHIKQYGEKKKITFQN